ncbi:MAG: VTT domain-containing protein [Clostridiales Family XIII bacterium]|jgi:uncharacterized membrane protein YdjX (TVP38/TMEM64 family)|nr:VTT domain-containing protein [Clostridiales Family XIII bacterium]
MNGIGGGGEEAARSRSAQAENKKEFMGKFKKITAIFKFLLLIGIAIGLPLLLYFRYPEILNEFRDIESINAMAETREGFLFPFFVGLQVFQVIVSIIPAQAVQIAAGYVYNFGIAYIACVAGLLIGTVVTYFIAKLLGRDAMQLLFGTERIDKFVDKLNSKRAYILLFIVFLIPGIPKDIFAYAAGISRMNVFAFFLISLVARTPALMASVLFGGMMRSGSYMGMIVLGAIIAILCILGLKFHNKLADIVNGFYEKLVGGGA